MNARSSLLAALLLALAAPAAAQPSREEYRRAKKLFEEAEALYSVGEYERALAEYKASFLLSREPALLYNVAQCERLLGRVDDAVRTYRRYLELDPKSPKRKDVERRIAELSSPPAPGDDPGAAPRAPAPDDARGSGALRPGGPADPGGEAPAARRYLLPGGLAALGAGGLATAAAFALRRSRGDAPRYVKAAPHLAAGGAACLAAAGLTLYLGAGGQAAAAVSLSPAGISLAVPLGAAETRRSR